MKPTAPASRSGLPYADAEKVEPREVVEAIRARRGGALLNLDRMLLHSPSYANGWNGLLGAIRTQLSLPARLRETVIVAIGVLNGAEYERVHHEAEYLRAGGTEAQLRRLRNPAAAARDAKLFDEAERAALLLTMEMTTGVRPKAGTLRRVRAALPVPRVVELVGTIAAYNMVSRFVVATGVELESPAPRTRVTRRRAAAPARPSPTRSRPRRRPRRTRRSSRG